MGKIAWLFPVFALSVSGWAQQTAAVGHPSATSQSPVSNHVPQKIMVSAGVMQGSRIGGDIPIYPAIAKAAGVQGTVVIQATIAEDGTIQDLKVISGPPMLQAAAMDAVRTWRYKPYLLNGSPVVVETQVNVVFTLGGAPPPGSPDGSQPAPDHPVTPDQVREIMQMSSANQLTREMVDSMMPAVRNSMPPWMPADVLQDFENSFLGGNLEDLTIRVYQAHLSTEDAAAVIAFYKTPAGQRFLAATPVIMKQARTEASQLALQVFQEVMKRHQTEIDAAKQKYGMDHPWSAPK
jgi:TonB family protein